MASKLKAVKTVPSGSNGILPKGWRTVRFGEVVRDVNEAERNPLAVGLERFIGLEHIEPENLHLKQWGLLADGEISFTKRFRKGQVLFGKRRAYQRKVAVADFDGICSSDILTLEPKGDALIPELLPFIVQSDGFFEHALGTSSGSLSPRTRWSQLQNYEFPLPPTNDQREIAEILWTADDAIERYKSTSIAISNLRCAVSKDAFCSKDYTNVLLGDLVARNEVDLQTGPFGTVLSASSYTADGVPVINPVHMDGDTFNTERGSFVSEADAARLQAYRMNTGDIVMVRKRHVGRMVHVKPIHEGFIVGSDCIRIRVISDHLSSRYLFHFLQSEDVQSWLVRATSGTVMPGINEVALRSMRIPIHPLPQQAIIVGRLDSLVAVLATIKLHVARIRDTAQATCECLLTGTSERKL